MKAEEVIPGLIGGGTVECLYRVSRIGLEPITN
jgi:hypothetical protein